MTAPFPSEVGWSTNKLTEKLHRCGRARQLNWPLFCRRNFGFRVSIGITTLEVQQIKENTHVI